ncbi:MAG: exonuclease domain-containing protein [Dehalobacter sp.]|nr:exonuclease domain-containing protein [Dehalobacter sp.]
MSDFSFAVLDVETTGLFPGRHDRIIEIAIINMDLKGAIQRDFETLINPDRDLGPTHIHKITADMVRNAPMFKDIAGNILDCLAGNIIVGHNISFDYRFLDSEFQRLGIKLPRPVTICTLNMAKKMEPSIPSGKLGALCDYFNIPITRQHSAYGDCLSTAKLLKTLMNEYGLDNFNQHVTQPVQKSRWPVATKANDYFKRSCYETKQRECNYIGGLIERLPIDLAMDLKISKNKALILHQRYLSNLVRIALLDGIITEAEMADLYQVAKLLNVSDKILYDLISRAHKNNNIKDLAQVRQEYIGKTVCFTGTLSSFYDGMQITREMAHKLAVEHGLIVKKGVTKDLNFLVTADPDSMSGKAKKAREYSTKILAEQTFWSMLGIQVS